ncbi:hypothetical protein WICMUC_002519 [Wickerhamomyces mucosus]|uniref:Uncharacterized protein n=1 Tax=Wickerhamomyces mucosus TaxID=1378264 RepID=A0A9P8PPK0_9ASCO|nr:hypothetical protein WICMUC_002519 [Wickerhamomyces mucosus]
MDETNVIQLLKLSDIYYKHAKSSIFNCQSQSNLKEYYTLIKLSLISLFEIIKSNQKISLNLKLQSYLLISQILDNESFNNDQSDHYLDQIIMLTTNNLIHDDLYFKYNIQAKFYQCQRLLNLSNLNHNNKQIYKILEQYEDNFLFFKYLKFQYLDKFSNHFKAIEYLQTVILPNLPNDSKYKVLKEYFQLLEINYCIQHDLKFKSLKDEIQPENIILQAIKQYIELIYHIQYLPQFQNVNEITLDDKFKSFAKFINENQKNLTNPMLRINFPFLKGDRNLDFDLEITWLNYTELNILFCISFGLSNLGTSFEKRKSLKLFEKALESINLELSKYNRFNSLIKSSQIKIKFLKFWQNQTNFYILLENLLVEDLSIAKFNGLQNQIINNDYMVIYLNAIYNQINGDLINASNLYEKILEFNYNDEIYLYSSFNYLLILESQISWAKRIKDSSDKLIQISKKKNQILEILQKTTSNSNKFIVQLSFKLIQLIYNYNSLSIIEINSKISSILNEFPTNFINFKKIPLLLAIILYINSSTLNSNSDEKQKTSQIAFNLSKFGNFKILRYITGLLNLNNAQLANNFQQVTIQTNKLQKIKDNLYSAV